MSGPDELTTIVAKMFKYTDSPIQHEHDPVGVLHNLFKSTEPVGELYEQKACEFLKLLSHIKLQSELTSTPLYSHINDVIRLIGDLQTSIFDDSKVLLISRYMYSFKGVLQRIRWNLDFPSEFDYLFDTHDLLDCVVTNNRITVGTDNTTVIEVKHHSVPLPIRVRLSGTFKQGDVISLYECSFYLSESSKLPVFFVTSKNA